MAKRKLQEYDNYRFGARSVLVPDDKFRATGGPVYVTGSGEKLPMYERGVFVFRAYYEQGAAKWIEAYRADGGGVVILPVGRQSKSRLVPGLVRKPYRVIRKVRVK